MPAVSSLIPSQPFENFFRDRIYLECKRNLYSYLRRKDEIARFLSPAEGFLLEVGCGTAPVTQPGHRSIFSDISHRALKYLREVEGADAAMVFSCTEVPLADNAVRHIVCSEVLEHIDDDRTALREMHRVLRPGGELILTVPVHRYYFSMDDKFVEHRRRYDIDELVTFLRQAGFTAFTTSKVAGPLEKLTAIAAVSAFRFLAFFRPQPSGGPGVLEKLLPLYIRINRVLATLVRWDGKLMPRALSTIMLIHCVKRE